jgi:hypothetical protein
MARLYIENDMARFTRKDITHVDMELFGGGVMENLEPRRLFPMSGKEKYITLLDSQGVEKAVIRDLRTLPAESRRIIEDCLEEYYLIPKVHTIHDIEQKFGVVAIYAETDRGSAKIELRGNLQGLKLLYGGRVLMRDSNDNRYEIPDLAKIDARSRQLIDSYL